MRQLNESSFINQYWQQQPVFIENEFHEDELYQQLIQTRMLLLAQSDETESRLITGSTELDEEWCLYHGPFDESEIATLKEKTSTLLVQAADHYIPELNFFLEHFSFLPHWRFDDIMLSLANTHGSVGPHYDNYDVLLVQINGTREWRVGPHHLQEPLLDHPELKVLPNITETDTYSANAGDVLYVPPGYAHHGVAKTNDCITLSVGFRSPSRESFLMELADYCAMQAEELYTDPENLSTTDTPGQLRSDEIDRGFEFATKLDEQNKKHFFCQWMSRHKYGDEIDLESSDLNNNGTYSIESKPYARKNGLRILMDTESHRIYILGCYQEYPANEAESFQYLANHFTYDGGLLSKYNKKYSTFSKVITQLFDSQYLEALEL